MPKSMIKLHLSLLIAICFLGAFSHAEEEDPIEVQIGEKLFMEERFSQWFFQSSNGDVNQPLRSGDPTLDKIKTDLGIFDHPLKGRAMSCAACHFVDQLSEVSEVKVLTYNDFMPRTPIPKRNQDNDVETTRHTSNMVGMVLKDGVPLHWDGEFFSGKDLSCASLIGRNMGWVNEEGWLARRHIVDVVRKDVGTYPGQSDLSDSYKSLFSQVGLEIDGLSDEDLFDSVCEYISIYMQSLDFERDEEGYVGSAYDQFLEANQIRRGPKKDESSLDYIEYLKGKIFSAKVWKWISPQPMKIHQHPLQFGDLELEGLKIFLRQGQCAQCHTPPEFTDFKFHATGLSQLEYEQVHGSRTFSKINIPSQKERLSQPVNSFVATEKSPTYLGIFRKKPTKENSQFVDLGVWNIFLHPDKKSIESQVRETLCESLKISTCGLVSDEILLKKSIGMFKTPTLRSLGQSAPYFSNGISESLDSVLQVYMITAVMAQRGLLVNADETMKQIRIRPHHFGALKAFLESLDEDYE